MCCEGMRAQRKYLEPIDHDFDTRTLKLRSEYFDDSVGSRVYRGYAHKIRDNNLPQKEAKVAIKKASL